VGDKILTAALVESLNRDPASPTTRAARAGDGWIVTGTKTCVPAGTIADAILVPATTDEGVGVFIVEPGASGVTIERQMTTNKESEAFLTLDGAPGDLLGDIGAEIVHWIVRRATLGLVAQQLGVLTRAMEMTAEYAINRVQFDRPIATFQAVGHRCADAYIDVEGVRLTLLQAVWKLEEGLDEDIDVDIEVAKFWASDAGHRVAHTTVHIHGGVGIDNDAQPHRYFVAAKKGELTLGNATDQLLRVGAAFAAS
jgi:acyl-CoA dehydrogenase